MVKLNIITRFMEVQGLCVVLICSGVWVLCWMCSWICRRGRWWCSCGSMSRDLWLFHGWSSLLFIDILWLFVWCSL